jgi:hypothetical protein
MTLQRFVSDLEEGDVFVPVRYTLSSFVIREYCHGNAEDYPGVHGPTAQTGGVQVAAPTLSHIEKIRLYKHNCPGGQGPKARIHVEYFATHFAPIPAGTELITSGRVARRYLKRGRTYMEIHIEVRSALTDELYTRYVDTTILAYEKSDENPENANV